MSIHNNSKEEYNSVREYLDRWDELKEKISKLINYKGL